MMSQYNSTTTTTGTPLNATTAKGNRTSSQKSTSPRLPTTTITHTTKMTTGIYNRESHKGRTKAIVLQRNIFKKLIRKKVIQLNILCRSHCGKFPSCIRKLTFRHFICAHNLDIFCTLAISFAHLKNQF